MKNTAKTPRGRNLNVFVGVFGQKTWFSCVTNTGVTHLIDLYFIIIFKYEYEFFQMNIILYE